MNNKLNTIIKAVTSIQVALLRFRDKEERQNLHVKIAYSGDNSLHCSITGEIPPGMKIDDNKVNLVQKYQGNYFFISGYIPDEMQGIPRILSIVITKATWFVRKSRGSVTWLREKHTYENEQEKISLAP
jgi:hypothetical protein